MTLPLAMKWPNRLALGSFKSDPALKGRPSVGMNPMCMLISNQTAHEHKHFLTKEIALLVR